MSDGSAEFDRTANAQEWGGGKPDRPRGRSLRPLLGLMPYVRQHRLIVSLAAFFLLLSSLLNVGISLPLRQIDTIDFDNVAASDINSIGIAFVAIAILWGISSSIRFYFFSRFGERLSADVRSDVYANLLRLSPAYFSRLKTGEAVSRLTADVTLLDTFFGSTFSMAMRSIVTSILALGGMFLVSWKLTLMLFVITPFIVLPVIAIGRRVRKLSVAAQDRIADAAAEATETLDAVDLVQAYGMESERDQRFRGAVERSFQAALKRINARSLLTGVIIVLMFGGLSGVIWIGALAVLGGDILLGEFVQFVFLAMIGVGGFATVAEVMGDAMRASGAAQRISEILDEEPDIAPPEHPRSLPIDCSGAVRLNDVTFTYPGATTPTLSGASIEARPGEFVALVGPSGAGKSTVFRLLLRFFDPQTGAVTLDGVDARDVDPSEWRARFSYVPQDAPVFSGDAAGNVRFGRTAASDDEVRAALERSEAWSFLDARGGLGAEVGAKGRQLSGGERQRIAIARALVRGAPVMLLDEATSALDAANERLVQKALEQAAQGRTSFVIAHRLATVRKADRIVVMDKGRVVEEGDHESLVRAAGLYAELAELQFTSG